MPIITFSVPEDATPGDDETGMQPATSACVLGKTVDDDPLAGANIAELEDPWEYDAIVEV
jgi:hypothetical protein